MNPKQKKRWWHTAGFERNEDLFALLSLTKASERRGGLQRHKLFDYSCSQGFPIESDPDEHNLQQIALRLETLTKLYSNISYEFNQS